MLKNIWAYFAVDFLVNGQDVYTLTFESKEQLERWVSDQNNIISYAEYKHDGEVDTVGIRARNGAFSVN